VEADLRAPIKHCLSCCLGLLVGTVTIVLSLFKSARTGQGETRETIVPTRLHALREDQISSMRSGLTVNTGSASRPVEADLASDADEREMGCSACHGRFLSLILNGQLPCKIGIDREL